MDVESMKVEDYSLSFGITVATSESNSASSSSSSSSGAASFVRIIFNGNGKSSKGYGSIQQSITNDVNPNPNAIVDNALLSSSNISSLREAVSKTSKETSEELQSKKTSMGIELGIKEMYELIGSLRNSLSDSANE